MGPIPIGIYIAIYYLLGMVFIGRPIICLQGFFFGEKYGKRYSRKPGITLKKIYAKPFDYFEDEGIGRFFLCIYPVFTFWITILATWKLLAASPKFFALGFWGFIKLPLRLLPKELVIKFEVFMEKIGNIELIPGEES